MPSEPHRLPHEFRQLAPDARCESPELGALDGHPLQARLYLPARADPDVAALIMHPRGDFLRHYLVPELTAAGYAVLTANSRYLHNDADALHERLCLDVGGAVAWLRQRGFGRVVLVGNSGGGSLFALYQQQAARAPSERLERAPSGDPVALERAELLPADALVLLAAHPGEGRFLLDRLDPSVVDETDPVAAVPALDMYDRRNGYRPLEEGPSRYAEDFLAAYRAAQRARCERLDRQALAWCEEAAWHRARLGRPPELPDPERAFVERRAWQRRYRVIYRTLADPRYLDPALDPSERPRGSIFSFGRDPVKGNYGEGLSRVMSARGWLSTWSGLSSHAALDRTLPEIAVPSLLLHAAGDQEIFGSQARAAFTCLGTEDKVYAELPHADHYLRPLPGAAEGDDPVARACRELLLPWLRERFPV